MFGLLSMRCLITFPLKFKRLRGSKFVSLCKQHDIVVDLISHGIRTVWWDISYRFLNASIRAASMESVRKYLTWIFPGKTNKTWKASSSEKVRGIFMLTSIYKFICCQKTALATGSPPVWESVLNHLLDFNFFQDTMEQLMQQFCIRFCQKLDSIRVETIGKIPQQCHGHHTNKVAMQPFEWQPHVNGEQLSFWNDDSHWPNAELWSFMTIASLFLDSGQWPCHFGLLSEYWNEIWYSVICGLH